MDGRAKVLRQHNPRDNANILSKITFLFACGTFRKGFRKQFEEQDVYDTSNHFSSTKLSNRLETEWEKEKKKQNPGLTIPLIKLFGIKYILWGVTYFSINTIFVMSKPLLKGKIISYFAKNETSVSEHQAYYYTGGLSVCIVGSTLLYHSYAFGIEQIILKIKVAISGLVYRKSLKLDSHSMSKDTSGQAITLITKDIDIFDSALLMLHKLWVGTIQTFIMIYIMYAQIGPAALVGALAVLLPLPVLGYLGKKVSEKRLSSAKYTDERVRKTQELLTSIETIKMYTWETFFEKAIINLRKKEITNLRMLLYIKALILSIGLLNAKFGLYFCIITYVALGHHVTAEKAFVVTGCFASLQSMISIYIPWSISQLADLKTSLQRISNFLTLDEINQNPSSGVVCQNSSKIFIKNANVTLEKTEILKNINLQIQTGVTVLTGTIGAGKSTLLKLILNDVNKTHGLVDVNGSISYASQEPWLFPGSVKQNIIFNELFDQKRYRDTIQICALQKDFDNLPIGDETCLTDKGLNLSRGQKCRINLARAIYKVANIYLLDDCLSAVDGHVGKHIFYELKKFFTDNICILVTHQELFLRESNNIIILNQGSIEFDGTYDNLKKLNLDKFKWFLKAESNVIEYKKTEEEYVNNEKVKDEANTKNVYKEVMQEGKVNKKVYFTYFKLGGSVTLYIFVILLAVITQGVISWNDYFVSFWVDMEQEMSGFRYNQTTYLEEYKTLEKSYKNVMILYSVVIVGMALFTVIRAFCFFYFTSKASINIHKLILKNVVGAKMMFFNKNLSGNVLNRLSRDLAIIDEHIPSTLFQVLRVIFTTISTVVVISTVNPMFLIPSSIFLVVLYVARNLYLPTARSIRRLEGATRSPVIGHFNSTIEGLTTIRANCAQEIVKNDFDGHQDIHNSVRYMHVVTMESFSFYLDILADTYIIIIIFSFLIFKSDTPVGKVGLAITQAFILTRYLQWGIRQWAELENHMTSSERILEYKDIQKEVKSGEIIKDWPKNGKISFHDVTVRYNPTSENVLNNVNFVIEPKKKIGIVGRTGAGKSTIVSALYRLYEFDGTIKIDNIDTKGVELNFLRKNISIIPQDPVLFTGTIRNNLDPFCEYSDEVLWKVIEKVNMKKAIGSLGDSISETGSNYSVGQRQLICLARALIRKNCILVLDEATASMDPQTDALIQNIIQTHFCNCTAIIIAHRLNTILDTDKILVVDFGKVLQYDTPQVLLQDKNGTFYKMVQNAGLI
ncbi:hypothetical protein RN001_008093 [Aquatica leii]|uniref:Multidrug resistance-associated protein lethal(2)03659 n=1 Tax=Aquatica leii TaxID=1421715 RepID=A0AAN7SGE5_9COLE|nr:hypothetical protein RN001_008093 [Aquatica leii]